MSDSAKDESKTQGVTAEFDSVDRLLDACRRVRDAGYKRTDAFTPFPVHGIDKALGIRPTLLPWIVLGGGLCGCTIGVCMQIWMNSIDYPYIISGKPYVSLPAFVPVSFELTILLASFGAFFGMLALNKLPRFSNPLFSNPRFDRATDDRFFLYIGANDALYREEDVRRLLNDCEPLHVEDVVEDDSSTKLPSFVTPFVSGAVFVGIVAFLVVLGMLVSPSGSPRFHIFYDMDFSPAKDGQQITTLFSDGRAMRPDVPGTVARGDLSYDVKFRTGIDTQKLSQAQSSQSERFVRLAEDQGSGPKSEESAPKSEESEEEDNTPWLAKNPIEIDQSLLERGRQQFNVYCIVCHGADGAGKGLVHRRAQKLLSQWWIPPTSLHDETLAQDQYPDGKLFSTITNGVRKMPGYASQIAARDRWAVVAYVRALQESRNADLEAIPEPLRQALTDKQEQVLKAIEEQKRSEEQKAEEQKAEEPEAEEPEAEEKKTDS